MSLEKQQAYFEDLQERIGYLYELINETERELQVGDLKSAYNAFMRVKRQMPRTELVFGVLLNDLI